MRRRLLILAVLLAGIVIGAVAGYLTIPKPPPVKPIIVGSPIPLTGPYSKEALHQQMGLLLAAKEINEAGGVLGRPVKVLIRDDELSTEVALRRTEELLGLGAEWIIGTLHGGIAAALNKFLKERGIPYMGICMVTDVVRKKGVIGPYTFYPSTSPYHAAMVAAEFLVKELGLKRIYIIYADYAWGWAVRDAFKAGVAKFGGEIVGESAAPLGAIDYTPYLMSARAAKPDALYLINFGRDTVVSIKQVHELGLKREMTILQAWTTLTIALGAGPEAWEGVYSVLEFYWELDLPSSRKLVKAFMTEYGEPADTYSYYGYTGLKLLADAANAVGSLEKDKIATWLEGRKFDYGKGEVVITPKTHFALGKNFIVIGKPPKEIKERWDIYRIVKAMGGTPEYLPPPETLGWSPEEVKI